MTNMMKALGSYAISTTGFNKNLNDSDLKYLQEIIKLHALNKPLHANVYLQSLNYKDCNITVISAQFDQNRDIIYNCIHPVLAALFIPKFPIIDSTFLRSNISGLVKNKYNNEPLYRSDNELFYNLINDPNDVVCDNKSSILDLLNRTQIQSQLWNNVLHLRNGKFYHNTLPNFLTAIDNCRINKYDSPDMIYGRHDGIILKRILATFSFRPTVVSTWMDINKNPFVQTNVPVVSRISTINVKINPIDPSVNGTIDLSDQIKISHTVLANSKLTDRQTNIIYSNGVLIFYIDRRNHIIKYNRNQLSYAVKTPIAVSGFHSLNDFKVIAPENLMVQNDSFNLRSVVVAEISDNQQSKQIIGSSTFIINKEMPCDYFHYDPLLFDQNTNPQLNYEPIFLSNKVEFDDAVITKGIIFIYELQIDDDSNSYNFG